MVSKHARLLSVAVAVAIVVGVTGLGACGGSKSPRNTNTPTDGADSGTQTPGPDDDNEPGDNDADSGVTPGADSGVVTPGADSGVVIPETDGGVTPGADSGTPTGPGKVACPVSPCGPTQKCCYTVGAAAPTCRDSCAGGSIDCDSPSDCGNEAPLCCFKGSVSSTLGTCYPTKITSACASTCPLQLPATGCSGAVQGSLCGSDADCAANGADVHCCSVSFGGFSQRVCRATACADAGT